MGALVVARIAGQDGQRRAERRRGDDQIRLRERMLGLAAFLDQQPPFEHDVFGDGQDAPLEHRSHLVREPVVEFGALAGLGDELYAEADFGESHGADVEIVERAPGDEGEHSWFGLRATQLGENIRIEQPTRHRSTPRTGVRARFGSMSMSRKGEACIAAMSAPPLRSPLRRRNSSAEMMTTSSRPWTVTCCGPSLRTRRTSSLKRALASCRSQWPGSRPRARRPALAISAKGVFLILVMLTRLSHQSAQAQGND